MHPTHEQCTSNAPEPNDSDGDGGDGGCACTLQRAHLESGAVGWPLIGFLALLGRRTGRRRAVIASDRQTG
ncbi:MAG: hypothetical protein KF718_13975 [Polyangiaceae bacterium]|nr:hypothetical protein [Polyangiaceae bacterium]